jgi:hypothetical protein
MACSRSSNFLDRGDQSNESLVTISVYCVRQFKGSCVDNKPMPQRGSLLQCDRRRHNGFAIIAYRCGRPPLASVNNTELARRGLDEIAGEPVKRIFSSAATSARSRTLARRTSTGPTPVWMARCGPWPCWRMLPARRLPARSGRPNRDCRKRDIRSRLLRNPHFVPRHRKYAGTTRLGVQTAIMPSASI